jgi:hypothetical protein
MRRARLELRRLTGYLERHLVRRELGSLRQRVDDCYERHQRIADDPTDEEPAVPAAGDVSFHISAGGVPMGVTVVGFGEPIDRCIATAVQNLVFPRPAGAGLTSVTLRVDVALR